MNHTCIFDIQFVVYITAIAVYIMSTIMKEINKIKYTTTTFSSYYDRIVSDLIDSKSQWGILLIFSYEKLITLNSYFSIIVYLSYVGVNCRRRKRYSFYDMILLKVNTYIYFCNNSYNINFSKLKCNRYSKVTIRWTVVTEPKQFWNNIQISTYASAHIVPCP